MLNQSTHFYTIYIDRILTQNIGKSKDQTRVLGTEIGTTHGYNTLQLSNTTTCYLYLTPIVTVWLVGGLLFQFGMWLYIVCGMPFTTSPF